MALEQHAIHVPTGSSPAFTDRTLIASIPNVANASGAAGVAVSTTVSVGNELPASYGVFVTPSQAAFVSVSAKTNTGFTVTLTPTTSTASIAAGTFDVLVVA